MNIFKETKDAVSVKDAASFYGIKINRNSMCCCPFHNDKNPSMKVDSRYHCFGCGADGDVIDFVGNLYGLSPIDSVRKIISDFRLNIDVTSTKYSAPVETKRDIEQEMLRAFKLIKRDALNFLREYYYFLHTAKRDLSPQDNEMDVINPLYEEALVYLDRTDWMIEELEDGTFEQNIEFLNTYKGEIEHARNRVNELRNNQKLG